MVRKYILAVTAALFLSGCEGGFSRTSLLDVKIPIATKRTPPPELMEPVAVKPPVFVSVLDKQATSALTADGEADLRILIATLLARLDAWQDWAEAE